MLTSRKKEYDDVISYSKKSLAIAQESGQEKKTEVDVYNTLGAAHWKKEEHTDAHSCFTEAMKISRDLKD